jgi:hypothetical protein
VIFSELDDTGSLTDDFEGGNEEEEEDGGGENSGSRRRRGGGRRTDFPSEDDEGDEDEEEDEEGAGSETSVIEDPSTAPSQTNYICDSEEVFGTVRGCCHL